MSSFLINILASVIGGVFLLLAASLVSHKARWILTGLIERLLNIDIDYVFDNKDDSTKDIVAEIKRARDISILTSRGNELQRGTFASLFHEKPQQRQIRLRILLPQTALDEGEHNWIQQREAELAVFDKAYGKGLLRQQIEANILFIKQYTDDSVELRLYNSPHIGRIIITDRFTYYTPYRHDAHPRDSKVYKFRRGGEMHDNLLRLFNQLWNASVSPHRADLSQAASAGVKESLSEKAKAIET